MRLTGKTALLTGATGGLGRAIANALADGGASVVVSSRKADALVDLARSLPGDGHRAIVADLGIAGAAEKLVADAGDVDIVVANAGLPGTGRLSEFTEEQLVKTIRVNLEAPMRIARALVEPMIARGEGHFVFISSLAGKAPAPRTSVYNATKFGLRGFALGLRCDLVGTGVGVSVVSPGFVREAGMFADSGAKAPPGMGTTTPAEVAAGVVRAIVRDKPEVAVAPRLQRTLAHFALVSPSTAVRVNSGGTARRSAESLAQGQADKR